MQETRAVWSTPRAGDLSRLTLRQEPVRALESHKIRVRVKAVGLNFADVLALAGLYSATPKGRFIPGLEFAGVVDSVGQSVTAFRSGDAVMGVTRFGGYASIIDIDPIYCQSLPTNWSFAQGAAFLVQTLTAWYALKVLGDVRPRQNILLHSAAGGVGLQVLAICAKLGVNVIGTVGSSGKKEFLRERGFERVIIRDRRFPANVQSILGDQPLNLVLDAIGGGTQRKSFDLLAPTGRLVVFGAAEFAPGPRQPHYLTLLWRWLCRPRYDALTLITANKSVMGFNLIWLWNRIDLLVPLMTEVTRLDLPAPYVGKVFPFAEAPAAVQWLRGGQSIGKVVLVL